MKESLVKLGLTPSEATVYETLLILGETTVKEISKSSGFHRTNIYDVMEQLKEKGLVAYYVEGKTTYYRNADPNVLYDYIKEKKDALDNIFPTIEKYAKSNPEKTHVEVFKGREGMKSVFRDMLRIDKPIYGYGVRGQLREKMPDFAKEWLRDAKKSKLPYFGIYTGKENAPSYFTELRYVSKELSSPVAVFMYGNKININIWEPTLIAITITSDSVYTMYKNHFDLIWNNASEEE